MKKEAIQAAICINQLFENGSFGSDPWSVDILSESSGADDGAGISYGTGQTIENNGGLYDLLFETYASLGGAFSEAFDPYRDQLYQRGGDPRKKGALTYNMDFRDLLKIAGRDDPIMLKAQGSFFHERYMKPALDIMDEFDLSLPLSLVTIYDFCIQSGPGKKYGDGAARDWLVKWNESEKKDAWTLTEKDWTIKMLKHRDQLLSGIDHAAWTRYRTQTMILLTEREEAWEMALPLSFLFKREGFRPGWRDREVRLTAEDLKKVYAGE